MAYTSLSFPLWNPNGQYVKFDVAGGVTPGDTNLYYSTQGTLAAPNVGNSPSGQFTYNVSAYGRADDVVTLTYTHTGGAPFLAPGSMVVVNGATFDPTVNYTGMITNGGSGYISYMSPGWDVATTSESAGTITTQVSPVWTTGCFFIPAYSTTVDTQQSVITAAFEPGYEQRQAASINPNADQFQLVFSDRSNKEMKAIRAFVQKTAGVYSFPIMIPIPELANQPNQKFVVAGQTNAKVVTKSYNINDVSFVVRRVFDF